MCGVRRVLSIGGVYFLCGMRVIFVKFLLQVKSLKTKSNEIEHDSTKTLSFKSMIEEVGKNTKKIFMPPIVKYTWISIVINLSFHIG